MNPVAAPPCLSGCATALRAGCGAVRAPGAVRGGKITSIKTT